MTMEKDRKEQHVEISYKRDLSGNYLLLEDPCLDEEETTLKMLELNHPASFLELTVKKMNGHVCLWYEITSMQPLDQVFERRQMEGRDIRMLLEGMADIMADVRRYLLSGDAVCYDPSYIYVSGSSVRFLYVPGSSGGLTGDQKLLAEYILKNLNHKDADAVALGYAFYEQVQSGGFDLSGLGLQTASPHTDEAAERREGQGGLFSQPDDGLYEDLLHWDREETVQEEKSSPGKTVEKGMKPVIYVGGAAVISLVFGAVVWFGKLDLTQIGGLFFGIIAVIWLVVSIVTRGRNRNRNIWADLVDDRDEDEEAFLQALMQDVYADPAGGRKAGEGSPKAEVLKEDKGRKEDENLTRALGGTGSRKVLYLISQDVRRSRDLEITTAKALVGKSREYVDECIPLDVISRIHACIEQTRDGCFVTDRNSTNGTFLNGIPLTPQERTPFSEGDTIAFATVAFKVSFRNYL